MTSKIIQVVFGEVFLHQRQEISGTHISERDICLGRICIELKAFARTVRPTRRESDSRLKELFQGKKNILG